jgi:hypothetical protein
MGRLIDREKVIKAIGGCINDDSFCNKCDYDGCVFRHGSCEKDLLADALALLKEQAAVKPRISSVEQRCGNCNKVIEMDGWIVCPWCGKPIAWEGR